MRHRRTTWVRENGEVLFIIGVLALLMLGSALDWLFT